jgi:hypothetical protein
MHQGGSTKPWCVTGIREDGNIIVEVACVVKLFKEKHIIDGNSIAKEFICNELSKQFDLVVPEAFLINVHEQPFIDTLSADVLLNLSTKYNGPTFCSELINASIVNVELRDTSFSMHDCATLFAFDCLVLNSDRGGHHNKANLLMDDDSFILIDHELSLYFIDSDNSAPYDRIFELFECNDWPNLYQKHIFYGKLKSYRGNKKNLFDTFEVYLSNMDVNGMADFIQVMKNLGISVGASELLIDYLRTLKENSHKFSNLMLNLIS